MVSSGRLAVLRTALVILPALYLAGCNGSAYPQSRYDHQGKPHYGPEASVFDAPGASNDPTVVNATIGDHNPMWRAAVETLSVMPLVSANATSGIIITDWYSDPLAPNERQKVNAYIIGRDVRPESLRVSVFRQQRGSDGTWVDAPADKVAADLVHQILARARRMAVL
jgi:hypothetical protein